MPYSVPSRTGEWRPGRSTSQATSGSAEIQPSDVLGEQEGGAWIRNEQARELRPVVTHPQARGAEGGAEGHHRQRGHGAGPDRSFEDQPRCFHSITCLESADGTAEACGRQKAMRVHRSHLHAVREEGRCRGGPWR